MDTTTAELTVVRTDEEPCRCRLDIEVPVQRVNQVVEETTGLFSMNARIPGFRPGKSPRKLLENRYGSEIAERSKQRLLSEAMQEAVEKEGVEPETTPKVVDEESLLVRRDVPFVFSATFEVAPTFELPDYKGLKIARTRADVGDERVDEVVNSWLRQHASYERVERPAARGDLLKVAYTGTLEEPDEEIPEATRFLLEQENTWLALQDPELIPGCIDLLAGAEAGEVRESDIEFPEDYPQDALAGKRIHYRFEIREVHASQVPELTDEIAREVGAESGQEVRDRIRASLEAENKQAQEQSLREQILRALLDGMTLPLPETLLRSQTQQELRRIYQEQLRAGGNAEELYQRQQELSEQAAQRAVRELLRYYVLRRIAKAEGIEVGSEELQAAVTSLSQMHRVTPKVMLRRLRDSGRVGELAISIRESKTLDRLVELADVTETDPDDEG